MTLQTIIFFSIALAFVVIVVCIDEGLSGKQAVMGVVAIVLIGVVIGYSTAALWAVCGYVARLFQ